MRQNFMVTILFDRRKKSPIFRVDLKPQQRSVLPSTEGGYADEEQEFGFGMYDGITGLVTQPLRGAEKDGAAGLIKGIGKGIGGLVLKPGAGEHIPDVTGYYAYNHTSHLGYPWLHVHGRA